MEWTRKHQNLTTASACSAFRSSVNKDEQELQACRQTSVTARASNPPWSAEVVGLKNKNKQTNKQDRQTDRQKESRENQQLRHQSFERGTPVHVVLFTCTHYFASEDAKAWEKSLYVNEDRWASEIHKLLSVDLIWGHFLVFGRVLLKTFGSNAKKKHRWLWICHFTFRSLTFPVTTAMQIVLMNSSLKAHFTLSVLTLAWIFIGEIEPCQFEIQTFRRKFHEVLTFGPRVN